MSDDKKDKKDPVLTEFPDVEKLLQEVEYKQEERKNKTYPVPNFSPIKKKNLPN